jgi:hypothetical protein
LVSFLLHLGFSLCPTVDHKRPGQVRLPLSTNCYSPAVFWECLDNTQVHAHRGYQLGVGTLFPPHMPVLPGRATVGLLTTCQAQSRSHGNHLSFGPLIPLKSSQFRAFGLTVTILILDPQFPVHKNGSKVVQGPEGQSIGLSP